MQLFHRKPIIAFNLDEVKLIARRWKEFFRYVPHINLSAIELDYIESLIVVDLAYQLLSTGKYRVVFFHNGVSKKSVRQNVRECIITVTKYSCPNKVGRTITPSYFPPMTLEWFMNQVEFRSKPVRNSAIDIKDPLDFYSGNTPSVKKVDDYLNEGYM